MKIFELLDIQYQKFNSAIKKYLAETLTKYNYNYGKATIFGQFMQVLNAAVQNIMLYIEDSLTEQNKYTAQRKKSIYGLAKLSGYEPNLGNAAGVQLKLMFTANNEESLDIILQNHTNLVCTQNGLNYSIILPQEAITLSPKKDYSDRYIFAVQGKFEQQTAVSTGGKYYTQNFKYVNNIDLQHFSLKINDEIWEKVESIYDMEPIGKQYCVKPSYSEGIDVIFGNDIHGKSLEDGDVISINYLIHDGEYGNLDSNIETYFVFDDSLYSTSGEEIDGNNIYKITFASNDAVSSGSNSESTESVRQNLGYNSRSLVLASPDNYKIFLNKFSFCGYNRTWAEKGSMVVNSIIMKNYKTQLSNGNDYFSLKESDLFLTENQKNSIKNNINNSGMQLAGVTYNIYDPIICKYAAFVYIKLKSTSYDKNYITNQIRNLIGEYFANIQSDIFIPKSDIIHLLKTNINEIDGVNVYFLSEQNETALQTKYYNDTTTKYNPSTGNYDKITKKITLYDGENPNLGLDSHGNIYLDSDELFPVLMGGWDYLNSNNEEIMITDPLIIVFE